MSERVWEAECFFFFLDESRCDLSKEVFELHRLLELQGLLQMSLWVFFNLLHLS